MIVLLAPERQPVYQQLEAAKPIDGKSAHGLQRREGGVEYAPSRAFYHDAAHGIHASKQSRQRNHSCMTLSHDVCRSGVPHDRSIASPSCLPFDIRLHRIPKVRSIAAH
ncbi:hypothetical protein PHSY_002168 [Pseudozyma hubeiensis SY62]|uniref:Uncharacterized protein n=1 Tax=Pseudozyma hubeiensis (strain SY62) TaxID=1305764 RepID=R9P912_PSEHS|nr:hypothetical protein PHSY_002168 [Pseudozyma hubeiensis SY62]GAC94595.1 hypothetical protein PHSY_002168 [Pseudozyma hubeiensis SY62]